MKISKVTAASTANTNLFSQDSRVVDDKHSKSTLTR